MRLHELSKALFEKLRWPSDDEHFEKVIRAAAAIIVRAAASGDDVTIVGFGTFRFVDVKEKRVFTNGVARVVPARRVLKFFATRKLRGLGREGGSP